jgi:hypothetical protein
MYDLDNIYNELIEKKLDGWFAISDYFEENGEEQMAYALTWAHANNKIPYVQETNYVNHYNYEHLKKGLNKDSRFWWFRLDGPRTDKDQDTEDSYWYKHSIPVGIAVYMPKLGQYKHSRDAKFTSAKAAWTALAIGLAKAKEVVQS